MADTRLMTQVRRVWRGLKHEVAARAETLGLTPAQLYVLWRLWQEDGVVTSSLVDSTGPDSGTITGVVDRLEAKGLVRRERSSEDRRVVRVFLTEGGRELEAPLEQAFAEVNDMALKGVSAVDRESLIEMLDRIGENLGTE